MKWVFGIIGAIALVAVGVYVDIYLCLVRGVELIAQGLQAHPSNGGDIAWGVVRIILSGVGVSVTAILAALLLAGIGAIEPRSRSRAKK